MGAYNPLRLRIGANGVTVDKYGRVFEFDSKEFKRKRKRSAWPGLRALKPTGAVT